MPLGQRCPQALDVATGFRIHHQYLIAQRLIQGKQPVCRFRVREVRFRENHQGADIFQFRKREQLIQCQQARRRIGERRYRSHSVDVRGHRFSAAFDGAPRKREGARLDAIDQRAAVFENANVHAIARSEHFAFSARALEVRNARAFLGIEHDVRRIFTDGNDASREGVVHAPNDVRIVDWVRTLRIDAPPSAAIAGRVAALARDGVRVRMSDANGIARTYASIEGPEGVDPVQLEPRIPDARWYDAEIIALAIEPLPADALPVLARALGGPGAPAGVCDCTSDGTRLFLEFRPDVTPAGLLARIIEVELRRFGGSHRTKLISPLSMRAAAAIAADGLQAPEIAADRILESLLGIEHVVE